MREVHFGERFVLLAHNVALTIRTGALGVPQLLSVPHGPAPNHRRH
jgi:hypothetical protein